MPRLLRVLAAACLLAAAGPAEAAPPQRVVSMNLCTDQLAMMLARPGQLTAISDIASDPVSSAMSEEAATYPAHHNSAEEIFLLQPDLVLAGAYSPSATLDMLRRLGLRVEVFPIGSDFDDVRASVRRMGMLLGTQAHAEALIARMDAEIDTPEAASRPRAAIYYSNGFTSGAESLADAVLAAAGYDNIAVEKGYRGLSRLPLETLVLSAPELLVTGQEYESPARAQEILGHPALRGISKSSASVSGRLWVCATPRAAEAVAQLRALRQP